MSIPDKDDKALLAVLEAMADVNANSQLEKLLGELHAECRAYRDTEFRALSGFLTIIGFVLGANVLILSNALGLPKPLVLAATVLSVVFCVVLAWLVLRRFAHDHLIYQDLFRRIGLIRQHWHVREFFPSRAQHATDPVTEGKGTGMAQNAALVCLTTAFVVLIILVGLVTFLWD